MESKSINPVEKNSDATPQNEKALISWVKTHSQELIAAGISIAAIVSAIIFIKNMDSIETLWDSLNKIIKKVPPEETVSPVVTTELHGLERVITTRKYTSPTAPFDVSRHIRTMAANKHHSPEKAAEAATLGIKLLPNQTLVDAYIKCVA